MKHIVLDQTDRGKEISLLDLLQVIDHSENPRIFIDDDYVAEINPTYAEDLLKPFRHYPVTSIETVCSKTLSGEVIIHLCIYLKRVVEG